VCDGAKHGGPLEPRDTELDLSEADFAPAQCAVLLKSCVANGDELDTQAFNTAVSGSTFPLCNEHHVSDSGTLGGHMHVTCDGVQNGEVSTTATVQYDAIGLPLCTENPATSNYLGTATAHDDVLLVHDTEAAERLSTNCEDHTMRHDVDSDLIRSPDDSVTTSDLSSALSVSTPVLACGGQDVTVPRDELSTCQDKNIEEGAAVGAVNADRDDIVCIAQPLNGGDLACETGNETAPIEQDIRNVQWDNDDAQQVVDKCCDVSVPSDDIRPSAAQGVMEVHEEVQGEIRVQEAESLPVDDVVGFGIEEEEVQIVREIQVAGEESETSVADSYAAQSALTSTEDVDEVDDGIDKIDETASVSEDEQSRSASAAESSVVAEAVCRESDRSPEGVSDLIVTAAACCESSWVKADGTDMCSVDRVERIITNDRSRAEVKLDSCGDLVNVVEDFLHAACGLESDPETKVDGAVDANEVAVCSTAQMVCETDSGDTDALTSSMNDAQSAVDANCLTTSLPSLSLPAVSTAPAETAVPSPEEVSVDIADRTYDLPAAGSKNQVDSLQSLQELVSHEMYLSLVSEVTAIAQPDNELLLLNDGGDAQNVETCQKESDRGGSDSMPVAVNDAVAMDTDPAGYSERSLVRTDGVLQLNGDLSDVTVETTDAKAPCYTALSTEPPLNVDFSTPGSGDNEQARCGLNNTVMPNAGPCELAGLEDSVSGEAVAVCTSPFDPHTSNSVTQGLRDEERDRSDVDVMVEAGTHSTRDLSVGDQDQMETRKWSDEGHPGVRIQSDEDAERWFEEQFAACEDFDVDEFVSSAWSEFRQEPTVSVPAVGNIRDEMLEQHPAVADGGGDGEHKATDVESADAWHHLENAAFAANAVDGSTVASSGELSQFMDGETDTAACYVSSSDTQNEEPSAPGTIAVEVITP